MFWDFPGGPVVKTLPSKVGGAGLIPSQGAEIPHASWPKNKKQNKTKRQIQYCNKFNKDFKNGPHPKNLKKKKKASTGITAPCAALGTPQTLCKYKLRILCAKSRLTLCDATITRLLCPWDSPGKNTGVGLLEWFAEPSSRGLPWPGDRTPVSYVACIGRWVLYH